MRILFVHEKFGAFGGAEANIRVVAGELKGRGHVIGVLHGPPTGRGEAEWREIFTEDCFSFIAGDRRYQTIAALRRFQPDLIYIHKLADLVVLEALTAAGIPIVRMVHDHEMYCMRGYKYNWLTRRVCQRAASPFCVFPCGAILGRNRGAGLAFKWVSYRAKLAEIKINRRFQCLIVATEYMRNELLCNGFDPVQIHVLAPVCAPTEAGMRSTFSDRNLVIYAGQILRGKGVDVLLEALALVKAPFECVLLGEGSHRPYCEALNRKLGLADRVRFLGYVSQAQVRRYFRNATVMVMSSVWPEPFGAVGLEAMWFGLPVVAFDAGGIKEWLIDGHNGFLVPWMDRAAYAARVETLLRDKPLAALMGERGFNLVRQRHDLASYVTNLERVFAQLVEAAPLQTVS